MKAQFKKTALCRVSILAVFIGLSTGASADGDLANGRTLAQGSTCTQCHGVDGNARSTSLQPIPMLAGQPAIYLVEQMKNYAEGRRVSSTKNFDLMVKELRLLSEKDFEDIAAYYEAQKRY
jgi:cytochrome c553